jgi:hypothetical protein
VAMAWAGPVFAAAATRAAHLLPFRPCSQSMGVNLHALPSTAKQASYHSGTSSSGTSSMAQQLLESGVLGCVAGALPLGYTHPLVRRHHHLCSGPGSPAVMLWAMLL